MDRGKNNTRFPEGKAGYLERENEIMLAADWEMLFGGWVVPVRQPQPCCSPWSSAEPPRPCPAVMAAAGLHHNARILSLEKGNFSICGEEQRLET